MKIEIMAQNNKTVYTHNRRKMPKKTNWEWCKTESHGFEHDLPGRQFNSTTEKTMRNKTYKYKWTAEEEIMAASPLW